MTDFPAASGRAPAPIPAPVPTPIPEASAQRMALLVLGGGALAILAGVVLIRAFVALSGEAALLIFGVAQSLLSVITVITGFYFGASLKQPAGPPP